MHQLLPLPSLLQPSTSQVEPHLAQNQCLPHACRSQLKQSCPTIPRPGEAQLAASGALKAALPIACQGQPSGAAMIAGLSSRSSSNASLLSPDHEPLTSLGSGGSLSTHPATAVHNAGEWPFTEAATLHCGSPGDCTGCARVSNIDLAGSARPNCTAPNTALQLHPLSPGRPVEVTGLHPQSGVAAESPFSWLCSPLLLSPAQAQH